MPCQKLSPVSTTVPVPFCPEMIVPSTATSNRSHQQLYRWRFIAAAVMAPAVLLAACSDDSTSGAEQVIDGGASGSEVDFDFTMFDGSTSNFTTYAGSPLVINFFSRTCAPCVAEMPEFESVFQDLDGAAAFVGISVDARLEEAQSLADETGVTYDLGWDPQGDLFSQFGGFGMPTTVLVRPDGQMDEVWTGVLSAEDLGVKISELGETT